jgi:hypothetical protein
LVSIVSFRTSLADFGNTRVRRHVFTPQRQAVDVSGLIVPQRWHFHGEQCGAALRLARDGLLAFFIGSFLGQPRLTADVGKIFLGNVVPLLSAAVAELAPLAVVLRVYDHIQFFNLAFQIGHMLARCQVALAHLSPPTELPTTRRTVSATAEPSAGAFDV